MRINIYITLLLSIFCINKISFATNDSTIPSLEATYGEWKVFKVEQNGRNVCYTVSTPKDLSGNHRDDRNPYIMVAFFGHIKQEVSITSGYLYKPKSIVSVSIDGSQERFIAEHESIAWPEQVGADKGIIKKMLEGFKILVFSESNASTYSVDTYSLSGFKKAYEKIKELCENK